MKMFKRVAYILLCLSISTTVAVGGNYAACMESCDRQRGLCLSNNEYSDAQCSQEYSYCHQQCECTCGNGSKLSAGLVGYFGRCSPDCKRSSSSGGEPGCV